ncbi:hypothetical protein KSF78_0002846 [Schistosoma japonicum]|nr:hypothetical protein KSF78_0002846 [Schistosoma japonicum]
MLFSTVVNTDFNPIFLLLIYFGVKRVHTRFHYGCSNIDVTQVKISLKVSQKDNFHAYFSIGTFVLNR